MAELTLFQKIAERQIPARIVYEDDLCLAFHDVNPQAPVHVLIVPRKPIPSLAQLEPSDQAVLGQMMLVASRVAQELKLTDGYRAVINCGSHGGQTVDHLHLHLLGGRPLSWPPG